MSASSSGYSDSGLGSTKASNKRSTKKSGGRKYSLFAENEGRSSNSSGDDVDQEMGYKHGSLRKSGYASLDSSPEKENTMKGWADVNVAQDSILRNTENIKPSYLHHVNTSIWVNHLRLNYILRISIMLAILIISVLFPWIRREFVTSQGDVHKYSIGPAFIAVDGRWHLITDIYNCRSEMFPGGFCSNHYIGVAIAAAFYNFGATLVVFVYAFSLLFPKRNIDRLNWLGLTMVFLIWSVFTLINNYFSDLSFGYYSMIVIIILVVITQSHYLYSRKKLRKNSLVNQLLDA